MAWETRHREGRFSPIARRRASFLAALSVVSGFLLGCQRQIDMAKDYDDRNAATTIRYTGVRDTSRQYADYGVIKGTILAGGAGSKEGKAP